MTLGKNSLGGGRRDVAKTKYNVCFLPEPLQQKRGRIPSRQLPHLSFPVPFLSPALGLLL